MAEKKIDETSLKNKGFLPHRQDNMFSMRLKVVSKGGRQKIKGNYGCCREIWLWLRPFNFTTAD